MLDTLWQAWKGFLLDTAELSFPVQQIPYSKGGKTKRINMWLA